MLVGERTRGMHASLCVCAFLCKIVDHVQGVPTQTKQKARKWKHVEPARAPTLTEASGMRLRW